MVRIGTIPGAWAEAAMEPGLGDREWHPERLGGPPGRRAAMEPGLGDREWATPTASPGSSTLRPQWSPVLETGNGKEYGIPPVSTQIGPQWSPVLETGNGFATLEFTYVIYVPQWSPVLETGNGEAERNGAGLKPGVGRNGARSWRPGMGGRVPGHLRGYGDAAMEPGLGDREWARS